MPVSLKGVFVICVAREVWRVFYLEGFRRRCGEAENKTDRLLGREILWSDLGTRSAGR